MVAAWTEFSARHITQSGCCLRYQSRQRCHLASYPRSAALPRASLSALWAMGWHFSQYPLSTRAGHPCPLHGLRGFLGIFFRPWVWPVAQWTLRDGLRIKVPSGVGEFPFVFPPDMELPALVAPEYKWHQACSTFTKALYAPHERHHQVMWFSMRTHVMCPVQVGQGFSLVLCVSLVEAFFLAVPIASPWGWGGVRSALGDGPLPMHAREGWTGA